MIQTKTPANVCYADEPLPRNHSTHWPRAKSCGLPSTRQSTIETTDCFDSDANAFKQQTWMNSVIHWVAPWKWNRGNMKIKCKKSINHSLRHCKAMQTGLCSRAMCAFSEFDLKTFFGRHSDEATNPPTIILATADEIQQLFVSFTIRWWECGANGKHPNHLPSRHPPAVQPVQYSRKEEIAQWSASSAVS